MKLVLDLSDKNSIFDFQQMEFNKKVTYIYGRNGTGKSTIAEKLKEYNDEYNVHVFKGFDDIIGSNNTLNAVALGTHNKDINDQIETKNEALKKLKKDIQIKQNDCQSTFDDVEIAKNEFETAKKKLNTELSKIAKKLKDKYSYIKCFENYNKVKLEKDIINKKIIEDSNNLREQEDIIKSDKTNAPNINFPNINCEELLDSTKEILSDYVQREPLARIGNEKDKLEFAKKGIDLHKEGDMCAFCGGKINKDTIDELETFFKSSDVDKLEDNINSLMINIDNHIKELRNINIEVNDFSAIYKNKINEINHKFDSYRKENIEFLQKLSEELDEKRKNLFNMQFLEEINCPEHRISEIKDEYMNLMNKINIENNELEKLRKEAINKLKNHYIAVEVSKSKYYELENIFNNKHEIYNNLDEKYNNENDKLTELNGEKEEILRDIRELEMKTVSEEQLAHNINEKLKGKVKFELIHCEDNIENKRKGFYRIKENGIERDVTKLSRGEKNVVAFLYFLEKINDIKTSDNNKPKLIVFDDPMDSNDDVMQYLIMEEFFDLRKSIEGSNDDKLILLTHNQYFYLNVIYGTDEKKCQRIRLISNLNKTFKQTIEKKDDFKTSYDLLWEELKFLYDNEDASPGLMLNPIRRIVETYTKFNGLNKKCFLDKVCGANKLFNVNSHGIDDLNANFENLSKEEIIQYLSDCFKQNGAQEHYEKHMNDKS